MTYLDTHVLLWLYEGRDDLLSARAAAHVDTDELMISPMVVVELALLKEAKRIIPTPPDVLEVTAADAGVSVCQLTFARVGESAVDLGWTRDPFDRLIVAHAAANDALLLTKDRHILRHYKHAVW